MRNISLNNLLTDIPRGKDFVFLETGRFDKDNNRSYLFTGPLEIISCRDLGKVEHSFNKVEKMLKKGLFAAGFISYEAGFAFESVFKRRRYQEFPLMWFGIFDRPLILDHRDMEFTDDGPRGGYSINSIKADISKKEYIDSIKEIKRYIKKGHTYQVNRTFKLRFSLRGCPLDVYLNLRREQSASYSAFIKFGSQYILSFSPELFFKQEKGIIRVKPMKGTIERGRTLQEDIKNADILRNCPKNRSENVMILDLLRNDLGRISRTGTVKTKKLFEIEKYESLFQMTSTAEGIAQPGVSLYRLFQAIFPSGSVTGAPKIRTMQIIDRLEKSPRGIYTGGIGFISPENSGIFNVAIRTLLLNPGTDSGEMGIGSGVVYDSDAKTEYKECLLKARFLTKPQRNFKLIETMLWEPARGYALMKWHMQRLSISAKYFNFKYDKKSISKNLKRISEVFDRQQSYRVRLLLDKNGNVEIDYSALAISKIPCIITISFKGTKSYDKWLYHKTTNRGLYDSEYDKYKKLGFFDVIFRNEKGQITEGAISNIFVKKNGIYYTPPIGCGVLNGVYRRYLLSETRLRIKEKALYYEDLLTADNIIMSNAIRGMVKVRFLHDLILKQDNGLSKNTHLIKEHAYA
jgi:para-aminobenzoate synthetase / 4-amino-4-deoxychorismate lyase